MIVLEQPLALLLALLIPIAIILDSLRRRRVSRAVPSNAIWRLALGGADKSKSSRPFSISLLLLVFAMLLTSVGAARPYLSQDNTVTPPYCAVLDTSASMSADGAFVAAKTALASRIKALPEETRVSVVLAGAQSETICRRSTPASALRALDSAAVTNCSASLSDATMLAKVIEPDAIPVVFSDSLKPIGDCAIEAFGKSSGNLGFTAASIRDDRLFFAVANYAETPYSGEIFLDANGDKSQLMTVNLAEGERHDFVIELSPTLSGRISLTLSNGGGLADDDVLRFVKGPSATLRVAILDSTGNHGADFGIERALSSFDFVETNRVIGGTLPADGRADAIIGIGVPITEMKLPGIYFLPTAGAGITRKGKGMSGDIAPTEHKLMHDPDGLPFRLMHSKLVSGEDYEFDASWVPVLECGSQPVLCARDGEIFAAAFLPYRENCTWVLDPSFVVFVGRFLDEAKKRSRSVSLERTSAVHSTVGFTANSAYNLLSDAESDLRERRTGTLPCPTPAKSTGSSTSRNIAWWFFAAAAFLLLCRAAVSAYGR